MTGDRWKVRHGTTTEEMPGLLASEPVHPDDPIAHGPRWRRERDQALEENRVLMRALSLMARDAWSDASNAVDMYIRRAGNR